MASSELIFDTNIFIRALHPNFEFYSECVKAIQNSGHQQYLAAETTVVELERGLSSLELLQKTVLENYELNEPIVVKKLKDQFLKEAERIENHALSFNLLEAAAKDEQQSMFDFKQMLRKMAAKIRYFLLLTESKLLPNAGILFNKIGKILDAKKQSRSTQADARMIDDAVYFAAQRAGIGLKVVLTTLEKKLIDKEPEIISMICNHFKPLAGFFDGTISRSFEIRHVKYLD